MSVLFYLAPVIAWLALNSNKKLTRWRLLLVLGLFAKLIFSFLMTYLVINNYDLGDLPTYYTFAKELAAGDYGDWVGLISGSYLVALLNSILFQFLPPSIYGLATFTGISSFLYCYFTIRSFDIYFSKSDLFKVAALLLFMPVFGTQSGYIGKETYILPLLGYVFLAYRIHQRITLWIAISVLAIGMIRPYQAIVLITALVYTTIVFTPKRYKIKALTVIFLFLSVGFVLFGSFFTDQVNLISEFGAATFFADTYAGGNLMLDPFPQPFTILQNFRPFFWETHNFMSMVASVENMIPFALGFLFVFHYIKHRIFRLELNSCPLLTFTLIYVMLNMIMFMYNSNIGDLARRHIYYYPQLILLGYFALISRKYSKIGCSNSEILNHKQESVSCR